MLDGRRRAMMCGVQMKPMQLTSHGGHGMMAAVMVLPPQMMLLPLQMAVTAAMLLGMEAMLQEAMLQMGVTASLQSSPAMASLPGLAHDHRGGSQLRGEANGREREKARERKGPCWIA